MLKRIGDLPFIQSALAALGTLAVLFICRTGRIAVKGLENIKETKRGAMIVMWHKTILLPIWCARGLDISPIIAVSREGNIIARFAKTMMKGETVRGSTGKDEGVSALRACLRLVRQDRVICITLDGPNGPAGTVHGGAAAVLKKTGCPFIACGCAIEDPVVFKNSWDKHSEPRPFGRSAVVFSEPQTLPEGLSPEEAGRFIAGAVDAAVREAEEVLK
ncbi:MAG: DUF374 domain-containing protein [Abditibacteriota bacterium]|nr:DUF374 domain-containing protein [Abditibacteriota bacterium]